MDGNIHEITEVKQYDKERENNLVNSGYRIVRVTNSQVLKNLDSVLVQIASVVEVELQRLNLLTKAKNSFL